MYLSGWFCYCLFLMLFCVYFCSFLVAVIGGGGGGGGV